MAAKDGCIDFMFIGPSPYPAAGSDNDSWIRHCRPPFMVSFEPAIPFFKYPTEV